MIWIIILLKTTASQNLSLLSNLNFCQELPGFYALRQHKNTQHGFPFKTANVYPDEIANEVNDANLKQELP